MAAPDDPRVTFLRDVLAGLRATPKTLPCKWFYDARGSALFEAICHLPEYTLTRTELEIMQAHAPAMAAACGPRCCLIEYGSGASLKTRLLLDRLEAPAAYVPVDLSVEFLARTALDLRREYTRLYVAPLVADFAGDLAVPSVPEPLGRRVVYFPGSTIGNFGPDAARRLFTSVARLVGPSGGFLVGADGTRDAATLEAAYDDAQGVTAAFNLNLLQRINVELGGTFALRQFARRAVWNAAERRIEMHLVSRRTQTVELAGVPLRFAEGESTCTEHSYKYDREDLAGFAAAAGFTVAQAWTAPDGRFVVAYAVRAG